METNCSTLRKEELIFRVRSLTTLILLLGCCLSGYSQVIKTYRVSDVDPQCTFYTNNGYPTEGGHLDITSVTTYTAFPRNAGYALKVVGTTGTFKEYANGTATLDVVYNLADKTTGALSAENWTMHIDLVGRTTTAPPHFPMGGACGNAAGTGFVYYNVSQGTVTSNIAGHGPYIVQNKDQSSFGPTDPPGGQYTAYFQMGNGASLRHPTAFGLGGWWDVIRVNNPDGAYPFGVGDSYLELEEIPSCTNPSVAINNTSPSICPGGNSTLSVSGCTGGTVAWSDGATGVSRVVNPTVTTTYSATCTIGDCNGSASTSVMVSPAPAPTVNSPSICAGQSAVLTVSNCSGTVVWSDGSTGLTKTVNPTTTTTYSATCTVGACSGSTTSTVTVSPLPTLSLAASATNVTVGTPVSLTANGCSGNVAWSSGQTGSVITVTPMNATQTYSATCTTPAGCSATAAITVTTQPAATCVLSVTVTPGSCVSATNTYSVTATIQLANGPTGILTISTGAFSQTIATTSSATTYTAVLNGLHSDGVTHSVLVSLAGCTSVTSTYTAPASCTITTCPPPVHVCKGSGYVYQLNTTPDLGTYQWYRNGIAISGATSSTYNATQAGSYSVVVNGNVAGTCPDNSCCPAIIVEDSIPDYQAQTQTATCQPQSNSVNSDGRILSTNWTANSSDTTTYYYEVNLGSTYDASQRIAGGSTIRVPSNGVLVTNIPNPVSVTGQAYTIRISSSAGCFKDELVILPQTTCSCPPAQCLPFVIRRIR